MPVNGPEAPASWARHLRATLVLALPLIGLQLAQMTMGVTDTVMLGWLGPRELAGGALGTQAIFLPYIFGVGFAQAVMPLAAAAQGAGDEAGAAPRGPHGPLGARALQRAGAVPALARRAHPARRGTGARRSRRSPAATCASPCGRCCPRSSSPGSAPS